MQCGSNTTLPAFNLLAAPERMQNNDRLYGTPALTRATQGMHGHAPVVRRDQTTGQLTTAMVNPATHLAVLERLGVGCVPYVNEQAYGFVPYVQQGQMALPVNRPDVLLTTLHAPDAAFKGTELLNPRPFIRLEGRPDNLNLMPELASEACRRKNVERLRRIHEVSVRMRLAASEAMAM